MAHLEPDLAAQSRRHQPPRVFDLLGVRVNADSTLDQTGDPPGKATVTTADIQNAGAAEGGVPQQR